MKTFYYIADIWEKDELNVEDAFEFESNCDIEDTFEVEWMVQDMAKDYVDNHDGWEIANSWSGTYRDFAVWDSDKNFIGKFEVLLEYEPTFSAWKKK
jgi:hypothetical protein